MVHKNDKPTIPRHVGLILDGNRRWAKAKGLPTLEGHRQGYQNLIDICTAALDRGVEYLSAYIFSMENWNRTEKEVKYLMDLAYKILTRDVKKLHKENVRVVWLGSRHRLSNKLLKAIEKTEESTRNNTRGTLCLCFNYGGHEEILDAARKLVAQGVSPRGITKDVFTAALYAPEVPPLDFLIRTSGELRTSGFMLYRSDYAELYFVEKHWPDFSVEDLDDALAEYARRKRRFGK